MVYLLERQTRRKPVRKSCPIKNNNNNNKYIKIQLLSNKTKKKRIKKLKHKK